MSRLVAFSALLGLIYEGATDPSAWPTIVPAVADWIGAPKAILFTPLLPPTGGGFIFPHAIGQDFLEQWGTRYVSEDIWTRRAVELGLHGQGSVMLDTDLVKPAEFIASRMYQEFLSRLDIARLMSGVVFGGNDPTFPLTAFSFFRSLTDRSFNARHRQKLGLLIPHLSRAIGVMGKLNEANVRTAATLATLDRISSGIVLLTASGQISYLNEAARAIFDEDDGLRVSVRPHEHLPRLAASHVGANQTMNDAIALTLSARENAVPHFKRIAIVPRRSDGAPYSLQFCTLNAGPSLMVGSEVPCAIVIISHVDRSEPLSREQMSDLYGLTAAETRTAEALGGGGSIGQVAAHLGLSPNTIKGQLKSVYAKLNVTNRVELARLIGAMTKLSLMTSALVDFI